METQHQPVSQEAPPAPKVEHELLAVVDLEGTSTRGYIVQQKTEPGVFPVYLREVKMGCAGPTPSVIASSEPTVFPDLARAQAALEASGRR